MGVSVNAVVDWNGIEPACQGPDRGHACRGDTGSHSQFFCWRHTLEVVSKFLPILAPASIALQLDQLFDAAAEPSLGWAAGSPILRYCDQPWESSAPAWRIARIEPRILAMFTPICSLPSRLPGSASQLAESTP